MSLPELLDWTWTAVMLVATGFWTAVLRRGLYAVAHENLPTDGARLLTLATITIVCVLLLVSSLLYADLIPVESSRFLINTARIALLVGGAAVWWTGRPKGVA